MPVQISVDVTEKRNQAAFDALFGGMNKAPSRVDVGLFQGAVEQDGTPSATVAAAHEFGAPSRNIPERSFMRSTLRVNRNAINEHIRKDLKAYVEGKGSKLTVFKRLGILVSDMMKARITASRTWATPLKPATIARRIKKFGQMGPILITPLIDTGDMRRRITYKIEGASR